ncbi:MAG: hypothetical protein WDZ69_00590 [Candidatus Pacearchaeota archaeon]
METEYSEQTKEERYVHFNGNKYRMDIKRWETMPGDIIEINNGIEEIASKFPIGNGDFTGFKTNSGEIYIGLDKNINYGRKVN